MIGKGFVNPEREIQPAKNSRVSAGPVEMIPDGREEVMITERLRQQREIGTDQLDFSQLSRESRHEDHRQSRLTACQRGGQLAPAHQRHANIGQCPEGLVSISPNGSYGILG